MNYEDWKDTKQKEFDALPIFFAFNYEQFKEAMEERGLTVNDTDKIYKLGMGGYYLRTDAQKIREFILKPDELPELMKDHNFAVSAFLYEMQNHEYAINYYQGDWDVCCCFCKTEPEYGESKTYKDYLTEDGHEEWIEAYRDAKEKYYDLEREREAEMDTISKNNNKQEELL